MNEKEKAIIASIQYFVDFKKAEEIERQKYFEKEAVNLYGINWKSRMNQYDRDAFTLTARRNFKVQEEKLTEACFSQLGEFMLQQQSLGTSSSDFISHPDLITFISSERFYTSRNNYLYLVLRFRIEDYLVTKKNNVSASQEKLAQVKATLNEYLNKFYREKRASGTAFLPLDVANEEFMRKLHSSDDELSALFLEYLPAPRATIFSGSELPQTISSREKASTQAINDVLMRNKNNLPFVERNVTRIQRNFRDKRRRKREEKKRISDMHNITPVAAQQRLNDANKPYVPQCEAKLAQRIMEAAKKVKLFSTVRHITSSPALESIFNDGLYGRRTMNQFYMPFTPAALSAFDIAQGDGNVVCLGANEIDMGSTYSSDRVELQFDIQKISKNNPCAFYKQRDLGYDVERIRSIVIGDIKLAFSHTTHLRGGEPKEDSPFTFYLGSIMGPHFRSTISRELLIAYDAAKMHQILTLNFFRFIDNFPQSEANNSREKIYSELNKLSDEKLVEVLQDIGKQMTDTMEFNFYGIYKIDFSALLAIKSDKPSYVLDLPDFVKELKKGNVKKLKAAQENLPTIFQSYRFIDFLSSVTNNQAVLSELQDYRKKCVLPTWLEESKFNPK